MVYQKLYLFTDGASRGNPGPAGAGVVVITPSSGEKIFEGSEFFGVVTNNEAEYRALLLGLSKILAFNPKEVTCHLDSELVVSQLNGRYKVKKARLRELLLEVKAKERSFDKVLYRYVPREKNKDADELANKAIDEFGGRRHEAE